MNPIARRRLEDLEKRVREAYSILERNPLYPAARVQIDRKEKEIRESKTESERKIRSEERLSYCLRFLNARGEGYLLLVNDLNSQKAYETILEGLIGDVFNIVTELPITMLLPLPSEAEEPPLHKIASTIGKRAHEWRIKGYERLSEINKVSDSATVAPPKRQESSALSLGLQIRALREECRWTQEELATIIESNERTVQRHELGEVTPYKRTLGRYEKEFSKQLKRRVVINRMP